MTALEVRSLGSPNASWAHIAEPKGYYYRGKTYLGWVNGDSGAIEIASYDHATRTLGTPFTLATFPIDDHNQPSIIIRASDGRIVVAYSTDGDSTMRLRISTNPEDVSSFGVEQSLDAALGGTAYQYPRLVELRDLPNDPLYLFYRDETIPGEGRLCYSKSTNGGVTWSAQVVLIDGSPLRPYWRIGTDWKTRVDVFITDQAPAASTALYHFYLDGTDDTYRGSSGTVLVTPRTPSKATLVLNDVDGPLWSFGASWDGAPATVIMQQNGAADNRVKTARWRAGAWQVNTVVASVGGHFATDTYFSGCAIDRSDPGIVYAARKIGAKFEMFRYTSSDDGSTWVSQQLTTGSAYDNVAPDTTTFGQPGLAAFWLYGTLVSAFSYDFEIRALAFLEAWATTATYEQAGLTYDDLSILYDGMPAARALSVLVGTLNEPDDLTALVKWDSLSATDNGSSGRGLISMRLEQPISALPTVFDQALVRVIDHALHADVMRGTIRSRKPFSVPGHSATDIIADDIGGLLDDTWIPSAVRPAETLVARITALWAAYASSPLDLDDLSLVASIGGTLLAQNFAGVTLRQAIEAAISQASASADYYVDALGRLHVFTAETNAAPFNIDADAPGAGEIAPHDLSIDYDSNAYANRVYIQGATPVGSGFFTDAAAIAAVGGMIRTAVMQAPDCETAAMATALANMYLGRVSSAKPRGSFSTTSPNDGWRSGQNTLVTSADSALAAAPFRIARVTTTVVRPGPTAADMLRRYAVEIGGARAGSPGGSIISHGGGQVVSGQLGGASNVYVTSDGVSITDGA